MGHIVFYSWASDWPRDTNQDLIGEALEQAALRIRDDQLISIDPAIDRDTRGLPGSPDISESIFKKIEKADAFVADVTDVRMWPSRLIGRSRPHPNPNVLVELGYAASSLGWDRILLVVNTSRSKREDLPFDLRSHRSLGYTHGSPGKDGRKTACDDLSRALEMELRAILTIERCSGAPADKIIHAATRCQESDPFQDAWAKWQIFVKDADVTVPTGWARSDKCMTLRVVCEDLYRPNMDECCEGEFLEQVATTFSEDAHSVVKDRASSAGVTLHNTESGLRFDRSWGWGTEHCVLGMSATLPMLTDPQFYSLPELVSDMVRLLRVACRFVKQAPLLVHFELHAAGLSFIWESSESRRFPGESGRSGPGRARAACAQRRFDDGSQLIQSIPETVTDLLLIAIPDAHGERVSRADLLRIANEQGN